MNEVQNQWMSSDLDINIKHFNEQFIENLSSILVIKAGEKEEQKEESGEESQSDPEDEPEEDVLEVSEECRKADEMMKEQIKSRE